MHYTNSNSIVMKQYRLLRDNKETGPYAAEELIQSGLRKYDLVWVEGKSAAWRYPCEIEVFKPFVPAVEEQPFDRFYKKSPASTAQQQGSATLTRTEVPIITEAAVKKEKPRFKIKADCQKIETAITTIPVIQQEISSSNTSSYPSYKANGYNIHSEPVKQSEPVKSNANTTATPAWENMWLDWEQEKKAGSNAALAKNVETRIKSLGEKEMLETKFSQSLDDIKECYVETILNKKRSSGSFEKYKSHLTAAVLLIAILAAGMWAGLKWSDKTGYTADKTPQQNIQLIPKETSTEANPENNQQVIDNNAVNEETVTEEPEVKSDQKQSNIVVTVSKTVAPASSQQKKSLPINKVVINTSNKNVAAVPKVNPPAEAVQKNYQPSATDAKGSRSSVKRNDDQSNLGTQTTYNQPITTNEVVKKTSKRDASIDDYVDIESTPVPSGVQYNVSNISDVPLDLVMIDLQYFDAAGRYLKGETVYARNIGAGQSVKVNAPQNAKAAGIKYKVAMVSSSENDLNIIAD